MSRLNRDQEEALMQAVMTDPRVKSASRALQNVNHCNESADKAAHNRFEQAVSNAVTRENNEHHYGLNAAQRERFADILVSMSTEGMDDRPCPATRPSGHRGR